MSGSTPRRRFQFRLRTLMIGVTLLAAALWVGLDRQRLIHERDQARQRATIAEGSLGAAQHSIQASKAFPDSVRLEIVDWLIDNGERRLAAERGR